MATKNIAITEDAYGLLVRHKRPHESFSEVIREHFTKKKHFLDYAGAWEETPEGAVEDIMHTIQKTKRGIDSSFRKHQGAMRL